MSNPAFIPGKSISVKLRALRERTEGSSKGLRIQKNPTKSTSTSGMSDTVLRTTTSLMRSNRTAPRTLASLAVKRQPTHGQNWSCSMVRGATLNSAFLRKKLFYLKKTPEVTMSKHVDDFSRLIEQIQFNNPPDKRWKDETINRRFVGTLDAKEWRPWIRSLGLGIATMTPVQLYAAIQLDDEVMNGGKPAETKEASLASRIGDLETRISDGKSGQYGKRGKRNRRGKRDRT